jgi:hypothetical protein
MTILSRLDRWKDECAISDEQYTHLSSVAREEPCSLFVEIHILLYLGVVAFVAGLGWTVATWSRQIGDLLILVLLTALLATCFGYSFYRADAWSRQEKSASSPVLDYVLYLGCLVWGVELAYIEQRYHLLSGQWDLYLLATAVLFFLLAYRFDNRFVLSLALSSLAGWLGVAVSHWPPEGGANDRRYALVYCLIVGTVAVLSRLGELKRHFFGTYLNVAANVLFCTVLSGVFQPRGYALWLVALLAAVGASLAWGIAQREFVFVAYAAVYGYVGVSSLLVRNVSEESVFLLYFVTTAIGMLVLLVKIGQSFGRPE